MLVHRYFNERGIEFGSHSLIIWDAECRFALTREEASKLAWFLGRSDFILKSLRYVSEVV